MEYEFEEERVGIHKAINVHSKRLITAYYSILESCQMDMQEDSLLRTEIDNFQIKLHNDSFIHSCKSLYTIASDLALNHLLHTPELDINTRVIKEAQIAKEIHQLQRQVDINDEKLSKL